MASRGGDAMSKKTIPKNPTKFLLNLIINKIKTMWGKNTGQGQENPESSSKSTQTDTQQKTEKVFSNTEVSLNDRVITTG